MLHIPVSMSSSSSVPTSLSFLPRRERARRSKATRWGPAAAIHPRHLVNLASVAAPRNPRGTCAHAFEVS